MKTSLPPELLCAVFLMNATDDAVGMKQRIQNTLAASHVSQAWRKLLLGSSYIWSRLIYVHHQQRDREVEMMYEILRRSRKASLRVHAVLRIRRKGGKYKDLLANVLSEHWPRIERLEMKFLGIMREPRTNHFLRQLMRPSPFLRVCHIEIPVGWSIGFAPENQIEFSPPLFANAAPNLRYLRSDYLPIATSAPYLSGLTTLITTANTRFTSSVSEMLHLLSTLPQLVHLQLFHAMSKTLPNTDRISPSLVQLPHLKYLAVKGVATGCLALIDGIQCPPRCLVNCNAYFDSPSGETEGETEDVTAIAEQLYSKTFLRNTKRKHFGALDWLFVYLGDKGPGITLADKWCFQGTETSLDFEPRMSSAGNIFSLSLSCSDHYRPDSREAELRFMRSILSSTFIRNVMTLRLRARGGYWHSNYPSLLKCLTENATDVRVLEADPDTLDSILDVWPKVELVASHPTIFPFPRLEVLSCCFDDYAELVTPDYRDLTPIINFCEQNRKRAGGDVTTLNLYTRHPRYWDRVIKQVMMANDHLNILRGVSIRFHEPHESSEPISWDSIDSDSDGEY
ncbi:hypothetical protein D9613_009453 [Agrocybe pediades]|uniref:F-box domain-containing protein n=1 Tax=Agrocybe pediades TaxID=84607 RepID=A0A8H4R4U6_9AGAR|nr:hypothetical protein D9613_009453 [Agrocybe pediades]